MAFIDEANFFVKAGDGGNGCLSFRREKYVPKGGPDGGDGGKGGDVILEATGRLSSLMDFKYRSHFLSEKGKGGQGKKMHGRKGKECILSVPVGSVIKDSETGEVLADLVNEGDRFVAAKGGDGGRGNCHFASAHNRAPRISEKGWPGEERWLRIELKLLADIGLVGLPNAGKSTLLSRLSAANPKVADYPFTTLEPQLGVLQFDYHPPCIIADIPGLIEGAHEGAGLGHKFLRHIERTKILIHLVDGSAEGEEAIRQYEVLENELRCFNDALMDRERVVLLNKIDLVADEENLASLVVWFKSRKMRVLTASAKTGEGLDELKELLAELLEKQVAAVTADL